MIVAKLQKKAATICNGFQKLIKKLKMRFLVMWSLGCKVVGLSVKEIHHTGIDLCGGGVIDKGDERESCCR